MPPMRVKKKHTNENYKIMTMKYRITKIRTKKKSFGTPVSIGLDEVVERMRSDKYMQAVENIANRVTRQLIEKQETGWDIDSVKEKDELPYLIFSGTFGRQGVQDFREPTGLVLLSVDYNHDAGLM